MLAPVPRDTQDVLRRFEDELNPAAPTAGADARIIGYGEVSTVFGLASLPGCVCKRMAGFREPDAVDRYVEVVARYIDSLGRVGIRILDTGVVPIPDAKGGAVVYLVQAEAPADRLGNHLLREAADAELLDCIDRLLDCLARVIRANRSPADGRTVTVDGQLANWVFPPLGDRVDEPILVDVGTPFMRLDGVDELDIELLLAPAPLVIRAFYRRQRAVQRYIDDYFDAPKLLLDLLGNFHKEGRPDRIDLVLSRVNRWLAGPGADLQAAPLTREGVDRYYEKDAGILELYLKLRRLDRIVRTRLLRRRYQFILPGPIRR